MERVGVWLYDDEKTKIKALDVFDSSPNSHSDGVKLSTSRLSGVFRNAGKRWQCPNREAFIQMFENSVKAQKLTDGELLVEI